jgi:hypothetical protein
MSLANDSTMSRNCLPLVRPSTLRPDVVIKSHFRTKKIVAKVDNRLTGIVDRLNEINQNMKIYVDEANEAQAKTLSDVEKRLAELIETKVKNYDKLVRKVVVEEFAKIGK